MPTITSTRLAISLALLTTPPLLIYRKHIHLLSLYPLHPAPSYSLLPTLIPNQPFYYPPTESAYISTIIPTPVNLDTFLATFYSAWTLRIEALLARLTGYPPTAFASGLFQPIQRGGNSQVVVYTMPAPALALAKGLGMTLIKGGMQELGVREVEGGWEVGYGCAEHHEVLKGEAAEQKGGTEQAGGEARKELGTWGREAHRFYMRFLLDTAAKKLAKQYNV